MTEPLERTAYMKWLIKTTENRLLIAQLLLEDSQEQNRFALEILEATGDKEYTAETFEKAADLVLSSKDNHGKQSKKILW